MFRSLLDRLMPRSHSNPRQAAPSPRPRLAVETLEDRLTPTAWFSIGDATILEGNDGTQNALVPVTLSGKHGNNVSVQYRTVDGTASAGSDYNAVSGVLKFNKFETTKTILVPIRGDRVIESDEYFSIKLSKVNGARIADRESIVAITDNEPRLSITGVSATEGNSGSTLFTFAVTLANPSDETVTVDYSTADYTAIAGEDYLATFGELTFAPGDTTKMITVEVFGDDTAESEDSFFVNLSGASANAVLANAAAYGTILDDDGYIPPDYGYYDYYYYDYSYYYGYYDYGYYYYYSTRSEMRWQDLPDRSRSK